MGSNQSRHSVHLFLFGSPYCFWPFIGHCQHSPAGTSSRKKQQAGTGFFCFFGISPSYVNIYFFVMLASFGTTTAAACAAAALESSRGASPVKWDFVLARCPQKSQYFFGRLRATAAHESRTSLSTSPPNTTSTATDTKADLNKQPIEKKSTKQRCIKQTRLLAKALPLSPDKYTAYNLPLPRIDLSSPCSRDESAG